MHKIKIADLIGPALDWAAAQCDHPEQYDYERGQVWLNAEAGEPFAPSTDWAQGGPIIKQERISAEWHAGRNLWRSVPGVAGRVHYGPTPLVAAMRCYVASKLGESVEIPCGISNRGAA